MYPYPGALTESQPDKVAVKMVDTGKTITYRELDDRSTRLVHALWDRGLGEGDIFAVMSENALEIVEAYWAALRAGMIITAINYHLSPDEAGYILQDSGAKALIVSAGLKDTIAEMPEAPAVTARLAFGGDVPGFESYEDVLAASSAEPLGILRAGTDMLYSSGTTGRPKGVAVPLPDRKVDEPGDMMVDVFGKMYAMGPDTVYLSPAPMYHAAPLRYIGLTTFMGGTALVMPKFDAEESLKLIDEYKVTHSQWVPTMFVRMLKLPEEVRAKYDVSSMRIAVHAAAPCPADVKRAMIEWWGPVIHEYYSSTEKVGVTLIGPQEALDHPGSIGRAVLGIPHVVDDSTENFDEVPAGQTGLIYFERDHVSFTYHNDEAKTKESQHPLHPNWGTTGDVGYMDEDGYIYLTDRRSFMIISGGVNIYPQEAENVLTMHPKVLDVAVFGVPDEEMGEQVKAAVQLAPGVEPSPELEQELLAFAQEHLSKYKTPRSIDFHDELPRTPTGKLLKRNLKAAYSAK
ncbi:acyl-CoA synthetase [Kribbia dieselivorans]|uniref:acyl-CoA synthetase n=1 Tax=Kribbia dieselivorans TaxID=331526 RepID=UPI000AF3601D|nr:acyl-CoA synthetase [Kribbia dieselivorans]